MYFHFGEGIEHIRYQPSLSLSLAGKAGELCLKARRSALFIAIATEPVIVMKNSVFLLLLMIIPLNAEAYIYGGSNLGYSGYPSHDCNEPVKPFKPYSFTSQWEIDSYNAQVKNYNSQLQDYIACLEEYTDNANNDIKRIQEKAREAIDDKNYW